MRFKISDIPFLYTVGSLFLILIYYVSGKTYIVFLYDILIIPLFLLTIYKSHKIYINKYIFTAIIFVFFHFVYIVISFGFSEFKSGRVLLVTILPIFIFYIMFDMCSLEKLASARFKKQFQLIVKINITFILIELLLMILGYEGWLVSLMSRGKYRLDLPSIFFGSLLGLDVFGPNSLLFGGQHASILSLIGVIAFNPFLKNERLSKSTKLWFLLSLVGFLSSVTLMSLIAAIMVFILLVFVLDNSKLNKVVIKTLFFISITCGYSSLISLLKYKFYSAGVFDYYMNCFLYSPFSVLKELPMTDIIAGIGTSHYGSCVFENLMGDNTYLLLIISHGALLVSCLLILYVGFSIKTLNFIKKTINKPTNKKLVDLINLTTVTYLSSLVLVVSMIHYPTLFRPGAREFFAFQIALSLVLSKKIKRKHSASVQSGQNSYQKVVVS